MIKQKLLATDNETKYRWIQKYNPMTATYAQVAESNITKNTSTGYSTISGGGGLYKFTTSVTYIACNNNNATTIISSTVRELTLYFLQYKSMVMSPAIVPPVIASPPFHILNISATL